VRLVIPTPIDKHISTVSYQLSRVVRPGLWLPPFADNCMYPCFARLLQNGFRRSRRRKLRHMNLPINPNSPHLNDIVARGDVWWAVSRLTFRKLLLSQPTKNIVAELVSIDRFGYLFLPNIFTDHGMVGSFHLLRYLKAFERDVHIYCVHLLDFTF